MPFIHIHMKKSLFFVLILITIVSCKQNSKFHLSGKILDAKGKTLYIEHSGLMKTTVLDSTKLDADGEFSFKSTRPEYPDFYRLRLTDKVITFAVDSCEDITITAKDKNFATEYQITGSEQSKQIQTLRQSVMNIQEKANALTPNMGADARNAKIAEIEKDIENHKNLAKKLILQNPRSTAAYFALYQQVNNTYLFSPYVQSDAPFCKAVATAYNAFMPEYNRTKNLYNLVLDAIRTERTAKNKEAWNEVLDKQGKGYIDIELKDSKGVVHKLSSLEGKVVLIDFSAYASDQSVDYTFTLRDLYNKYHSRGFEIYQVSLDDNKQLWEQSIANIPWICVRDDNGPNSLVVRTYNIDTAPTTFLMSRKGAILSRNLSFKELTKAIEQNL